MGETVGVFDVEVGDQDGVWAVINDLSHGKMPLQLKSLQIENGPFTKLLVNTQLSQFTQMVFQGDLVDIKAAVTTVLRVDFDASGKVQGASLHVRCQGDGTVGQFTGLSFVLMALEGRIIREVAAVLPIPGSVNSIKDLIDEVPHAVEFTDRHYVHMWPKSLFGGGFASFEIVAKLSPSEFSQVKVSSADNLADALAQMSKISKTGINFNYYIATVLTIPTPQLLAEFFGVGPELSSTLDFLLPIFDQEHFFGLGDIIQRITQSVGTANASFKAPSQIHTHGASSSRGAHIVYSRPQKTDSGEKLSA